MYKLHTLKVTKTVSSVTFHLHVFKKFILSLMLLLTNFKIRSKKLFNVLLGNFGPPTVGLSFKYLNSEMVISSLFSSLIALCKISDFFILRQP